MKDTVYVEELPNCYFCGRTAEFDGKTQEGPWAFMCAACFAVHGVGLGLGKGQRLRPREEEPKLLLYKGQPYALEIEGEVFVFYSVGLPTMGNSITSTVIKETTFPVGFSCQKEKSPAKALPLAISVGTS